MSDETVDTQVRGRTGFITLNRPKALNALSLPMIRQLAAALLAWRDDPSVDVVALRGMGREGPFGAFCAGGDIRFFHQAVLAGNPELEDFFTEEYRLNHLVHHYPKPYVVFMDGIAMGGGMGIAGHGARNSIRIVTERSKLAMPETNIGLFPDVGGGWFLSRCPGHFGDYLALTGDGVGAAEAVALGLAEGELASSSLGGWWERLAGADAAGQALALRESLAAGRATVANPGVLAQREVIARCFSLDTVPGIVRALEAEGREWARHTAATLRRRSPLMLHVTLEQLRHARTMSLADELRMERGMIRHCFWLRPGTASETFEGIRALAIDKDNAPRWNPPRIEDVTAAEVAAFFESPWPAQAHPLRDLRDGA